MMDVVSIGMVTIDDLVFSYTNQERNNLLGGAGTFAVLGARFVAGPQRAQRIGWVVHEGNDFPPDAKAEIESWNLYTKFILTPDRRTTRARNRYEGEERIFNFETPKLQVKPDMLDNDQLQAKTFHIISTPARCIDLVETILALRSAKADVSPSSDGDHGPLFVWEPMEYSCSPQHMTEFETAMALVDVFSPNELEFSRLVGVDLPDTGHMPVQVLRQHSFRFLNDCKLQAVVVRLGGNGVYVASTDPTIHDMNLSAYYDSKKVESSQYVIDVTGGGNAFLGAYCFALANDGDDWGLSRPPALNRHEVAAILGSVAASFVIEQFGMPKLARHQDGIEESWGETGKSVSSRVRHLFGQVESREIGSCRERICS